MHRHHLPLPYALLLIRWHFAASALIISDRSRYWLKGASRSSRLNRRQRRQTSRGQRKKVFARHPGDLCAEIEPHLRPRVYQRFTIFSQHYAHNRMLSSPLEVEPPRTFSKLRSVRAASRLENATLQSHWMASQWESSVFVSPINAPALMILDEYGAEVRCRFFVLSAVWATMLDPCTVITCPCRMHCC